MREPNSAHVTEVNIPDSHLECDQGTKIESNVPEHVNSTQVWRHFPPTSESNSTTPDSSVFSFSSWLGWASWKLIWVQVIISQYVNSYYESDTPKNTEQRVVFFTALGTPGFYQAPWRVIICCTVLGEPSCSFGRSHPSGRTWYTPPHSHTGAPVMNGCHVALMVTQVEKQMKAWGQITISPLTTGTES